MAACRIFVIRKRTVRQVAFRLLGCVPGHVNLRGRVQPLGDSRDTVKVLRPRSVLREAAAGLAVKGCGLLPMTLERNW